MEFIIIDSEFTVCQIKDISTVDFTDKFVFLSKTDDEISLVCKTSLLPENVTACEHNWRLLKISGVLDFSLIGVISKISNILSEAGISLFVVSTYNTDYILIKSMMLDKSIKLFSSNGYDVKFEIYDR